MAKDLSKCLMNVVFPDPTSPSKKSICWCCKRRDILSTKPFNSDSWLIVKLRLNYARDLKSETKSKASQENAPVPLSCFLPK